MSKPQCIFLLVHPGQSTISLHQFGEPPWRELNPQNLWRHDFFVPLISYRDYLAWSLSQDNPKQLHLIKHYIYLHFYGAALPANVTTPKHSTLQLSPAEVFYLFIFLDELYFGKCSSDQLHTSYLLSEQKLVWANLNPKCGTALPMKPSTGKYRRNYSVKTVYFFFLNTLFLPGIDSGEAFNCTMIVLCFISNCGSKFLSRNSSSLKAFCGFQHRTK